MNIHEQAQRGFERGAAEYERGRPSYPREALDWLGAELGLRVGCTVLDIGAGTGKLTRELLRTGAQVMAVEPVAAMREELERVAPAATVLDGTAEALPVGDDTVDAVTAAQAFHWFDGPSALAEFHRVLRPSGRLALIWNRRCLEEPLHAAIREIIEPHRGDTPRHHDGSWRLTLQRTGLFADVAGLELPFEHRLNDQQFVDRVASISFVSALQDREREPVLARVRNLAASHSDSLLLGYVTEIYVYERRDR